MSVLDNIEYDDHEQVVYYKDKESGLKAIIAVHSTVLGPAVGGCRMWKYSSEENALNDVLRLSKGMTYKSAMAGLPFGGGKAVIMGDSPTQKTPQLLKAYGRFVERQRGQYITAEDVGISPDDMEIIRTQTKHVVGLNNTSGDPSPFTALGVYEGMRASAEFKLGSEDLRGMKVAVQGVGHVGYYLCELLHEAGVEIFVCDINNQAAYRVQQEFGATVISDEELYSMDLDIYSPCALGATLNEVTIPQLKCSIIAGCANNQLAHSSHGKMLLQRDILYAPDYVINAGGIINISFEQDGYCVDKASKKVRAISQTLTKIYLRAQQDNIAHNEVADKMALEKLNSIKK
ncbi:MAG: Glu/Leu/Phe/Val dehydrogenase [Lentisphaeraceae bacterium]|nr:Glu/Leu/Phe/Val dehydrogenase [Lentisphaeraceae bacterium]